MLPDPPPRRTEAATGGSPRQWAASNDFALIPFDLVDRLGSYEPAIVWSRILYRAGRDGWWAATREDLVAETRLTDAKIRTALTKLRDAGLVRSRRVSAFNPSLEWQILWEGSTSQEEDELPLDPHQHHVMGKSSTTVMGKSAATSSSKKVRTPIPPTGGAAKPDGEPDSFAAWYQLYPLKKSRGSAAKAYRGALKKASAADLLAGLRVQLPVLSQAKREGFCPHPASWLNQERWADEFGPPDRSDAGPPAQNTRPRHW